MGFDDCGGEPAPILPYKSISDFLSFLVDMDPQGEVYVFGGMIRDLALFGKRGFSSDIDIVLEADWGRFRDFLVEKGAIQNRFGGFRFIFDGWPVDVWNAPDTWAIANGLVEYRGVSSLTDTTILNWDAALMNWRTKNFILRENYLHHLTSRHLDVVLEENPNPIGMVTRVLRHLCAKDARKVGSAAVNYLCKAVNDFSLEDIRRQELKSHGSSLIEPAVYTLFKRVSLQGGTFKDFRKVEKDMESEGWLLSSSQLPLALHGLNTSS
ncbi:MAG: hypothetical protein P1U67_10140 [Alcanivoracaceae bacterium]|nr:hypothetical protein [Alcanivoracaceae bacterium]